MALQVKAIAAKSEDFCLKPRTHMVKENSQELFSDFHTQHIIHTHTHMYIHTKKNEKKGWWLASKLHFRKRKRLVRLRKPEL